MANFTPDTTARIMAALRQAGVADRPCGACGVHARWTLADGLFNPNLLRQMGPLWVPGPLLPSVVLVCSGCGYTALHNLLALGLGDLFPTG